MRQLDRRLQRSRTVMSRSLVACVLYQCLCVLTTFADVNVGPVKAPTNVTLDESTGTLKWTDASDNEVKFRIERWKVGDKEWRYVGCTDWNSTSFVDPAPLVGKVCYRIQAVNFGAESPYTPVNCGEVKLSTPVCTTSVCTQP